MKFHEKRSDSYHTRTAEAMAMRMYYKCNIFRNFYRRTDYLSGVFIKQELEMFVCYHRITVKFTWNEEKRQQKRQQRRRNMMKRMEKNVL